jgi:parallel beta-helix repeat protein
MKKLLIIPLLFFSLILSATKHYVAASGGTFSTITQVSAHVFVAGDSCLFNRGETFYGTLNITWSGSAGSPIIIGAYGTGADPIITGFTTISGWTNEGSGIYSKVITSEAQTNMVTIDGVNTGMGRYPDATYLTYESCSNGTPKTITDTGLGDATDWAGAEVVIRKNTFAIDRCIITDHTGDVLTYTNIGGSSWNATADFGYFIQNDLRCVTSYGEWYHDYSGTGKFYMYFGAVDPTTKTVRVATVNNVIYNEDSDYITVDNVSIFGAIDDAVHFHWGTDYCVMQNCSVTFAGEDGIRFCGSYGTINTNFVSNCNRAGIGVFHNGTNSTVTNNTIIYIGLVKGSFKSISGIWAPTVGIAVEQNNCLIQYNTIENVGYTGIQIGQNAEYSTIKNNFINNICLTLDDGGGIYIDTHHTLVIIDGNIILNCVGNTDGSAYSNLMASGIYLDEYASGITVRNNTVANASKDGFLLHKANNNIIENNTAFNNTAGIGFENWTAGNEIYSNTITGNIFFAKGATQYSMTFYSPSYSILGFGTATNNYYARPIQDDDVFRIWDGTGISTKTLAQWQVYSSQDANSHKSPIAVADTSLIDFYYNATASNSVINLPVAMIDVKGNRYDPSITLLPYTSAVLMPDPNPLSPTNKILRSPGGKILRSAGGKIIRH